MEEVIKATAAKVEEEKKQEEIVKVNQETHSKKKDLAEDE